jgi:hypothetical protein
MSHAEVKKGCSDTAIYAGALVLSPVEIRADNNESPPQVGKKSK